ncbi:MAG: trypsin-like serine protease [Ruminococcaceae bacterium]|nr:trypsin-like serine protease [Oscillospiraceae bacterium]
MNNQNDSFNHDFNDNNQIDKSIELDNTPTSEDTAEASAAERIDGAVLEATGEDYQAPINEPTAPKAAAVNPNDVTVTASKTDDGVYRYVFTAPRVEAAAVSKKPKQLFSRVLFAAVTICLCVALSFGSGFVGTLLANRINGSTGGITPAPNKNNLYNQDPASVLNKEDSPSSIYGSAGDDVFSISQVVRVVQDAVVVIDVYGKMGGQSSGSGVIISAEGYILTCHHVVDNADRLIVTLNSNTQYEAALVGSDKKTDLAVIRIEPKEDEPLTYVEQGCSENLVVGEEVIAIGNPLGTLGGTVTNGIISATERTLKTDDGTTMTLLQTNAAINSGNSGGGLFNLDGKLVGIVNAKYAATGVEGLAFAIPIDLAYTVQLDLIKYGYVRGVPDHGLETLDVTNVYQLTRYALDTYGVYIVSSAYEDSLKNRDRIVAVNGQEISTTAELDALIEKQKVGDTVKLTIEREKTENKKLTKETIFVDLVIREYVPDYIEKND